MTRVSHKENEKQKELLQKVAAAAQEVGLNFATKKTMPQGYINITLVPLKTDPAAKGMIVSLMPDGKLKGGTPQLKAAYKQQMS